MPWPAIAMLALTGAKMVSDADKAERDRKLAAKTQLYSPWTNLKANEVEEADPAGTAAQGLGAYMGYEQAQENAALRKNLVDAQIRALDRGDNAPRGYEDRVALEGYEDYASPSRWQDQMDMGLATQNPFSLSRRMKGR